MDTSLDRLMDELRKKARVHGVEARPAPQKIKKQQRSGMYVYFITDGARVKIGVAVSPQDRMRELQTGNADTLALLACMPGGRKREAKLHKRFARYRIAGEWFELSGEISAYIEAIRRANKQ